MINSVMLEPSLLQLGARVHKPEESRLASLTILTWRTAIHIFLNFAF
jgi:hypothetical protein